MKHVLLREPRLGYGLYEDGKLIANYHRNDTEKYIATQLQMRDVQDYAEREHSGPFPEKLVEPKRKMSNAGPAAEGS